MSLLREIQSEAVSPTTKVSALLRKCKILAYRLGNENFKKWVDSELNGYAETEILPKYRILSVISQGHFNGPFGSGLRNADIPSGCFPPEFRNDLTTSYLLGPIAELESLIDKDSTNKILQQPWNPDFIAKFAYVIYQNMVCIKAWKSISSTQIEGVLDIVKTRILSFVLEIEALNPDAGEAALNSSPIPQEKVSQIFNINISGDVQNLASGNHHSTIHQEINNSQIPQEFLDLLSTLRKSEIEEELVNDLELRIEKLGTSIGTPEYTSQYGELMSFLSNHVTIYTLLAPFIPMLSSYLS